MYYVKYPLIGILIFYLFLFDTLRKHLVCFFEELKIRKNFSEISWPLGTLQIFTIRLQPIECSKQDGLPTYLFLPLKWQFLNMFFFCLQIFKRLLFFFQNTIAVSYERLNIEIPSCGWANLSTAGQQKPG